MKTIYKYQLEIREYQQIWIYENPIILSCQMQKGYPCIWASVDTDNNRIQRDIYIYETGRDIGEILLDLKYIDTVQEGWYVWHVFVKD